MNKILLFANGTWCYESDVTAIDRNEAYMTIDNPFLLKSKPFTTSYVPLGYGKCIDAPKDLIIDWYRSTFDDCAIQFKTSEVLGPGDLIKMIKVTDREFHYIEVINGESLGGGFWLYQGKPRFWYTI